MIFATLRIQYLEKSYVNQISAPQIADHLRALAKIAPRLPVQNKTRRILPPRATATLLRKVWRSSLRSAQRRRAMELCPHRPEWHGLCRKRRRRSRLRAAFLIATFIDARLTLQTRKLWLVGWCRDRPSRALPLTCPNVKNLKTKT